MNKVACYKTSDEKNKEKEQAVRGVCVKTAQCSKASENDITKFKVRRIFFSQNLITEINEQYFPTSCT